MINHVSYEYGVTVCHEPHSIGVNPAALSSLYCDFVAPEPQRKWRGQCHETLGKDICI